MNEPDDGGGSRRGRRSKVARLIEEYEVPELGAELERRWTAEGDRRQSLRELADYFNQRLLERALHRADVRALDGEIENTYRLLADSSVSTADRVRTRRRLEREGVDVEALQEAFVSYQAIRTYLRNHRGAEYESADRDRVSDAKGSLERLRTRTATVTESKLDRLRAADALTLGEFDATVSVTVFCEDCGAQYDLTRLLERGGCDCA